MKETDQHRLMVLVELANGKEFKKVGQVTFEIDEKKFHIKAKRKAKRGKSDDYPFNINNTVLEADYEVYICGDSDLYYVIPIEVIRTMHFDQNAMQDSYHPGYTIVHVRPLDDIIKYSAPSNTIDISQYKKWKYRDKQEQNILIQKYGGKGEGKDHRNLKKWIAQNPQFIEATNVIKTEIESHRFPSNDVPDIVFICEDEYFTVEIETDNPLPGAYQAVKYRALLCAELGLPFQKVKTVLIAWKIPQELEDFCNKNGILFFEKRL